MTSFGPIRRALAALVAAVLCFGVVRVLLAPRQLPANDQPSSQSGPTRVAVLSPAMAATMRDVGLGALIVGRHSYDQWSDGSIPSCGDQGGIDYEKLMTLRPTHVFVQLTEIPSKLATLAPGQKWTVNNFPVLTLDDIRSSAHQLAAWNGGPGPLPMAPPGRFPIDDRMDAAWKPITSVDPKAVGRVLLLASVDPPAALGPRSCHDDILRSLGATPAVTSGSPYIVMDAEDVVAVAPDAIILLLPAMPGSPSRGLITGEPALNAARSLGSLHIPAVASGRIAVIDDPMCQLPSTSMIHVGELMRDILTVWAREPGPASPGR